jgi:lipopolysaccharide transport system ATP-binding protein
MTAPIISVENLSKRYTLRHQQGGYRTLRDALSEKARSMLGRNGHATPATQEEFWALKDVSFEINRGDVVGIIGRNGAGKSTLLKILSRITEPTSGTIRLGGRVASLLEVGTGFHPELTGRENIFLNGAILGMTKAEIRGKFDEIVAFAEVEKFLDTPVKHYSSGMYVRLAFAVAAHLDPEILVVDEVLAVGDVAFQKKCMGKMRDVAEHGGRTILFVSHNMMALRRLCSRAILLSSGKVECDASVEESLRQYAASDRQRARHEWPDGERPGNERARLSFVAVESDRREGSEVFMDQSVHIVVGFDVTAPTAMVNVSVHLLTREGECVFASANLPSAVLGVDPLAGVKLSKGSYVSRCTIPADFLNDGEYRVSAFVVENAGNVIGRADEVLSFTVIDNGSMRAEFTGKWIGAIRPRLPWVTSRAPSLSQ